MTLALRQGAYTPIWNSVTKKKFLAITFFWETFLINGDFSHKLETFSFQMSYSRASNSFWARSWSFLKMGAWPEKGGQLLAHRGVWEGFRGWKYLFCQCTIRKSAQITSKPSPIDPGWNSTSSLWCGDFFDSIWDRRHNILKFPVTTPLTSYQ